MFTIAIGVHKHICKNTAEAVAQLVAHNCEESNAERAVNRILREGDQGKGAIRTTDGGILLFHFRVGVIPETEDAQNKKGA